MYIGIYHTCKFELHVFLTKSQTNEVENLEFPRKFHSIGQNYLGKISCHAGIPVPCFHSFDVIKTINLEHGIPEASLLKCS